MARKKLNGKTRERVRRQCQEAMAKAADSVMEGVSAVSVLKRRARLMSISQRKRLVLDAIGKGYSMRQAAEAVGVASDTIWRWLQTDREFSAAYDDMTALAVHAVADALRGGALKVLDDPRYTNAALAVLRAHDSSGRWEDRRSVRVAGAVAHVVADEQLAADLRTLADSLAPAEPAAEPKRIASDAHKRTDERTIEDASHSQKAEPGAEPSGEE